MFFRLVLGLLCLTASLHGFGGEKDGEDDLTGLVKKYVVAFNDKDLEGMLSMVSDQITWMSVDGQKIVVEASGKEALRASMAGYFKAMPSARSETVSMMQAGTLVTVHERALWTNAKGTQAQAALAIYRIVDGKIDSVWYYPAFQ